MTTFDIIGAIQTYCTSKGHKFIAGNDFYANYEADQLTLTNLTKIVVADFTCQPDLTNGKFTNIRYSGTIMFGQKFDSTLSGTMSNLDETFKQKYDRRLLSLITGLATLIAEVACSNELTAENILMSMSLNKFDTNIDFVFADVTFTEL